jgi:hypothetical protein
VLTFRFSRLQGGCRLSQGPSHKIQNKQAMALLSSSSVDRKSNSSMTVRLGRAIRAATLTTFFVAYNSR